MWKLLGYFMLVALIIVAIKLAFLLLLFAGLIFRTRQTLGIIFVLGVFALMRNYPGISFTAIGVAVVVALVMLSKKPTPPPVEITDESGG